MIRVECTYRDFDDACRREIRTTVHGLPDVLNHVMSFAMRELAAADVHNHIADSINNQLASHILNRFGDHPLVREWLGMIHDQLRQQLFQSSGPRSVPLPSISQLRLASQAFAESWTADVDVMLYRHFMGGLFPEDHQVLSLFPSMGREPLVKEILEEVKLLTKEEQQNRISALLQGVQ